MGVDLSHVLNKPIAIYFDNLTAKYGKDGILGIALGSEDDSRVEIAIDYNNWINMSDVEKTATMYHELSHDILNAAHTHGDEEHLMFPSNHFDSTVDVVMAMSQLFNQVKNDNLLTFDELN